MTIEQQAELPAPRMAHENDRSRHIHRRLELAYCADKSLVQLPCVCGWASTPAPSTGGTAGHKSQYHDHVLADIRG